MMVCQPTHPLRAACLLVRHGHTYDGTPKDRPLTHQPFQSQKVQHAQPFGVERPAPPDVPLGHFSAKWWI